MKIVTIIVAIIAVLFSIKYAVKRWLGNFPFKVILFFVLFAIDLKGQDRTNDTIYLAYDTIPVIILYSDTTEVEESHLFYDSTFYNIFKDVVPGGEIRKVDSQTYEIISYKRDFSVKWTFGYEVRELHNTDEGGIDPYHDIGYVSRDYFVHVCYLDAYKNHFPNYIIIWQSK